MASDGEADDYFGSSVSISGDYAVVGAYREDNKGSNAGAAYAFLRSGSNWNQTSKQTASDGEADDNFGYSVCISGDHAIVGAYYDDNEKGTDAGAAYIYHSTSDLSLPVELSTFTAFVEDGEVVLRWRTESEVNNIGFILFRGESREGPFTRITERIIPGAVNTALPREYSFRDKEVEGGRTYFYYIESVDISGDRMRSDVVRVEISNLPIPEETRLLPNYPNPFNPDTWIPYQLSKDGEVEIRIYDASGRLVKELKLGFRRAGYYKSKERAAYWDGKNELGEKVTSGVYFYQMQVSGRTFMRKMVILK